MKDPFETYLDNGGFSITPLRMVDAIDAVLGPWESLFELPKPEDYPNEAIIYLTNVPWPTESR